MKTHEPSSFGELLKKFRSDPTRWDEKPPSQAKLAGWLHVSVDTIQSYEQNKRFPDLVILGALAKVLMLSESEQSELASALRSTKEARRREKAADLLPSNETTATATSRNSTEGTTPSRNEPQPLSRRGIFEDVRRRRAIYLVAAVVVLLLLGDFVFMWIKSEKITISGTVLCIDNERVVGVWVSAVNDNSGSNFAKWYKTNSNGSEAAFRYDLPSGDAYNVHVGCGGSKQDWENTDYTEIGSGAVKDYKAHYFTCQDVPLVAGHGPCYLKR